MTDVRPAPFFIANHVGLDFLNSIAVPVDVKVEWLASGDDLLAWLKAAGLVPDAVLKSFQKTAAPGELDAVAARARALRDWFKRFVYKHMGKPIGAGTLRELEPLNQLLAGDEAFGQIVVRGTRDNGSEGGSSGLAWRPQRRWHSPESLLLPLAQALADLVCTVDFAHVKACEGPECTLLFVEQTRGRRRRWCSMAVCGNRAKQAAHRKRSQKRRKRSIKGG